MERHRFDPLSFVFGLLFAGVALTALAAAESFDPDLGRWFWPALLVVGGVVVLISTLPRAQRLDRDEDIPIR